MTCALGMLCLGGQANAAVLVTNGDFSDLTGLTPNAAPGWYDGVPAGWSGLNATFTVFDTGSNPVANLGQLASTSQYLSQNAGTTDFTGDVTLTFDLPGTFSGGTYSVGAVIAMGPIGNNNVLIYTPFTNVTGTQTLTATNVASGTPLSIGFFYLSYTNSPALDNVSISQVPEPSTWAMMLLGGVGILTVLRRRFKQA